MPLVDNSRASFRTISACFFIVIFIGTILLMLPISSNSGTITNFLDCLFTATSATCVTGLVVLDTATHWSLFGHLVILTMIQLGGMGVLTVALTITKASGRSIDLRQRGMMQSSISAPRMGGIVRLASFIIKGTLLIELCGAILLFWGFANKVGVGKGMWYAFFHSISAFCNAGFDLMGTQSGPFSSLTSYVGDPIINVFICSLIVIGGLGFLTWEDLIKNKWHYYKYTMQTKVILCYSFALITIPALYLFCIEMQDLPVSDRLWASIFQSITMRTAGFNTVDISTFKESTMFMLIGLMLIGGAPGSTAGGMKVTTLAALIATSISVYQRRNSPQCFQRRLTEDTVRQALAILFLYVSLFAICSMLMNIIEGMPLLHCMFEVSSAIATVGVSLGQTPNLCWISKLMLIALMFFGRVGGLTIIYATLNYDPTSNSRYPQGKLTVG